MILDFWFDSYKITDYCMVRNIYPYVAPKDQTLKVVINITIKDDVRYNLDKLNQLLFTREPKPLIISDTRDRYLMCELDGGIELTSRFSGADATLTFKSKDKYWYATVGDKKFEADGNGVVHVVSDGTAPSVPKIEVDFKSDSGFLSVVAPNGYLALGDKEQKDKIELPKSQIALNEEMHEADMSDWTKLTSDSHANGLWVPDYNKLSLTTGKPTFDQWGIRLTKSASPKAGSYWNCYAYTKDLAPLPEIHELTNFKLQSRVTMLDQSGTTKNTGMYLIVLMDSNNKPIVTTSIYNVDANSNEVTVTAKRNNFNGGANASSSIIHTAKFPNGFNGNIQMIREGSLFTWIFDSGRDQTVYKTGATIEKFVVGSTVYIKTSARIGYTHTGSQVNIAGFTRGRANKVTNTRTWQGKKQYLIAYLGTPLYWMNEEDLTANASGVGNTVKQTKQTNQRSSKFSVEDGRLATLNPSKVLIIGGTWDKTNPFTGANLTSVIVNRLNSGGKFAKISNTFANGDKLVIDNSTGEILLNGMTYQGILDVDSRFFDIDYGASDIQVVPSSWASIPKATITLTERFR